ncbi:hypothetical protein AB1Y20_009911 [Prymnesium parvum]|uniref:Prefoldin subunit 4 n=1 Tax=Prymnesium parvum TaxID=97485 RepID=A0AB34K2X1_PRYPA
MARSVDQVHAQITRYEELLNEQLKGELQTVLDERDKIYERIAGWPDTSSVYVAVGLGFHAQMTIEEAVAFATTREKKLNETAEALTHRAAQLKARVKLVVGAIDELANVSRPGSRA